MLIRVIHMLICIIPTAQRPSHSMLMVHSGIDSRSPSVTSVTRTISYHDNRLMIIKDHKVNRNERAV